MLSAILIGLVYSITNLLTEVANHNRIGNVDKSFWRAHPTGLRTWACRGAQNISLENAGNANDSFTVMTATAADQTKLPLSLIASGKTAAVEQSQFGDVSCHRTDHSKSRWTTSDPFERWLSWLPDLYNDGDRV
jgi:hypothetical protein